MTPPAGVGLTAFVTRRHLLFAAAVAAAIAPGTAHAATLYTGNTSSNNISALTIGADGALTPVAGSPSAVSPGYPRGLSFTPDGTVLFHGLVNGATGGAVGAFGVGAGGSLQAAAGPFAADLSPTYTAVTPNGAYLYVTHNNNGNRTIRGYAISGTTLTAVPEATEQLGGINPNGLAIAPDGRRLYTASSSTLKGFAISGDGSLSELEGSPYPSTPTMHGISITPDGRFLVVPDVGTEAVQIRSLAAADALPLVDSEAVGDTDPTEAVVSPDGRHVYTVNTDFTVGTPTISGFSLAADGTLEALAGSPYSLGAASPATTASTLAISPDGRFVYAARGVAGNQIRGFSRKADGTLEALPGSPFAHGGTFGASSFMDGALAVSPNQGPTARVSGTNSGRTATFDASASSDPDGSVARYDWDFGDGTTLPNGGPKPSHTYARSGAYSTFVTVTDDLGCSTTQVYNGRYPFCNGTFAARALSAVILTPEPGAGADRTAPVISKLSMTKSFTAAKGATIRFTLSEAARVSLKTERRTTGRKVGKRCVKATKKNRKRKACARYVSPRTLTRNAKAGANSVRFKTKLAAGRYRLTVNARDAAGNKAKARSVTFTVKKQAKAKSKPR